LKNGDRPHSQVEVGSQEVPEDLGPEEAFDGGSDLIGGCYEDDEASPVVLDEFAHCELLGEWLGECSQKGRESF